MRQNISKAFRTPFGLTDLCRVLFPYRAQLRPGFKCKPVEGSCRLPHALSTCLLLSYDSFLWEVWSDLPYFLDSWILNEAICFFHHPDEFCVIKRNWRFCVWKVLSEILGICEYELCCFPLLPELVVLYPIFSAARWNERCTFCWWNLFCAFFRNEYFNFHFKKRWNFYIWGNDQRFQW